MHWQDRLGEARECGTVKGVHILGLEDFPGRPPGSSEAADAPVLDWLRDSGCEAVFAENDLWVVLWVLLYWDAVFAKQPGSFEPRFGDAFPVRGQDIPQDLFRGDFFGSVYLLKPWAGVRERRP